MKKPAVTYRTLAIRKRSLRDALAVVRASVGPEAHITSVRRDAHGWSVNVAVRA